MLEDRNRSEWDVWIGTHQLRSGAERLLERTEPVTSLRIRSRDGDQMPPELVAALREAPCLDGIRAVMIDEVDLGRPTLEVLTGSPAFSRLEALALWECDWHSRLGPTLASMLADADWPGLRSLSLGLIRLRDAGLATLVDSPLFGRLEARRLGHIGLTDDGIALLTSRPRALAPPHLEVWGPGLGERARAELEAWKADREAT